jgi:prevent-host-death family protein
MRTASISETKAKLSALLERVKAGETVTITDRGVPVAQLAPLPTASVDWEERLQRLARQGIVRLPTEKLERGWLTSQPLPKFEGSVLEDLLEERRTGDR